MIRLETRSGSLIATYNVSTEREAMECAAKERVSMRRINATWMDLRGANLRGADLRGADLRRANLCETDLRGADLSRADWTGADTTDIRVSTVWVLIPCYKDTPVSAIHRQMDRETKKQQQREIRAQEKAKAADKVAVAAHRRILKQRTPAKGVRGAQARAASAALRQHMAQHKEQHP